MKFSTYKVIILYITLYIYMAKSKKDP